MNQQQQNHRLKMLTQRHWGLKLISLPNIRPRSAVVKREKRLSLRGGFLTYPMYHHGETSQYVNTLPGNKEDDSQLTDSQS